jgi:hypothetical protein
MTAITGWRIFALQILSYRCRRAGGCIQMSVSIRCGQHLFVRHITVWLLALTMFLTIDTLHVVFGDFAAGGISNVNVIEGSSVDVSIIDL